MVFSETNKCEFYTSYWFWMELSGLIFWRKRYCHYNDKQKLWKILGTFLSVSREKYKLNCLESWNTRSQLDFYIIFLLYNRGIIFSWIDYYHTGCNFSQSKLFEDWAWNVSTLSCSASCLNVSLNAWRRVSIECFSTPRVFAFLHLLS